MKIDISDERASAWIDEATASNWMPAFQNERELRQAILRLLMRMEFDGVQLLHGAREFGKDVVFCQRDKFSGQLIRCACVIKNEKISGKVGSKGSARALLDQIEQALDTPYTDGSGNDVPVAHVYVLCPFQITQDALDSIKGKLAGRMSTQVYFMTGAELYGMFAKYCPEALADESALFRGELESITKELIDDPISDFARMHNIYQGDLRPGVFVPPKLQRELHDFKPPPSIKEYLSLPNLSSTAADAATVTSQAERSEAIAQVIRELLRWGIIKERSAIPRMRRAQSEFSKVAAEFRRLSAELSADLLATEQAPDVHPEPPATRLRKHVDRLARLVPLVEQILLPLKGILAKRDVNALRGRAAESSLLTDERYKRASTLNDFCTTTPRGFLVPTERISFGFPEELLRTATENLLIVGGPGSGKTTLMLQLAKCDAEQAEISPQHRLSFLVPLARLANASETDFARLFLRSRVGPGKETNIARDRPIRLYLDGLDEITDLSIRRQVMKTAHAGLKSFDNLQIIVTARDYIVEPDLRWLLRLDVGGLDESGVRKLVVQWMGGESERVEQFFHQLSSAPSIQRLMRVPLFATITILVYMNWRRLPSNRSYLYNIYVDLLSGGWDLSKRVVRTIRFGPEVKGIILGNLAWTLQDSHCTEFDSDDLMKAARDSYSHFGHSQLEQLMQELLMDGIIVRTEAAFSFKHHSFQEFLAARYLIGHPTPDKIERVLREFLFGEDRWHEVIHFYVGLSKNPAEITRWLVDRLNKNYEIELDGLGGAGSFSTSRCSDVLGAVRVSFPEYDITEVVGYLPKPLQVDSEARRD